MARKKLIDLLAAKEARAKELDAQVETTDDVAKLQALHAEAKSLKAEIGTLRAMLDETPEETAAATPAAATPAATPEVPEQRSAGPIGPVQILRTYGLGGAAVPGTNAEALAKLHEEAEKRGEALKLGRAVTVPGAMLLERRAVLVGGGTILMPTQQATDLRPAFGEVSGLIDRVGQKTLIGGESFKQGYVTGYGTGDYKGENADFAEAEPIFGYATINKAKITAYAEDSEETQKLPAAAYDAEVVKGIRIANRKKIAREILIGDGAANHLAGIYSAAATAIDVATDLEIAAIDEETLDQIVFGYGGDEEVEDAAVLILSKLDLAAFSRLRTADGKKFHDIKTNGNSGTIDGFPFIINSACKAISSAAVAAGEYSMAYGPLSNYLLVIFSEMDVQRSTDYKFKQGMIAHRGSIFSGGNVVSRNGFLRIKKAAAA